MRFIELRRLTLVAALAFGCLAGDVSSASAQRAEVIVRTAPPAARYETRPRLRYGEEWVPGYWRWERRHYVWVPGHATRAYRGWVWQPARWQRRYDGWVFLPGRWVRAGRYNRPPPAPRPAPRPAPDYSNGYWERQGWVLLGEQWVTGNQDHDFVPVGRREGRFTRITLVARNSDFELHDIVITYANGRAWSPRLNYRFREGQRSRTLILPNGPRSIRSIKLSYGNLPGGGRALVQVWAR
jgi:hypothetical protein